MELSKKNHGMVDAKSGGMTIRDSYGKDDSDVTMSAGKERVGKFGGSTSNIPGISGASVKQRENYGKD